MVLGEFNFYWSTAQPTDVNQKENGDAQAQDRVLVWWWSMQVCLPR